MAVKRNLDSILTALLIVGIVAGAALVLRYGQPGESNKENQSTKQPPTAAAPAKSLPDTWFFTGDDRRVTLADFKGQVVLVNLWATWCPPCVVELPALDNLQARLKDKGFRVVAISLDSSSAATIGAFLQGRDLARLEVYWDKERQIPMKWSYDGLPVSFLLDRNGDIVEKFQGPQEWDKEPLAGKVTALLQ